MELPEDLMRDLMAFCGTHRRREAVRLALREFVRLKKTERLLALPGRIRVSDVTSELESLDLEEPADDSLPTTASRQVGSQE